MELFKQSLPTNKQSAEGQGLSYNSDDSNDTNKTMPKNNSISDKIDNENNNITNLRLLKI